MDKRPKIVWIHHCPECGDVPPWSKEGSVVPMAPPNTGRFLSELQTVLPLVIGLVGLTAYVHTKFATKEHVDQRFAEAVQHSNNNANTNRLLLQEIQSITKSTDTRLWELQKDMYRDGRMPANR